MAAGFDLIVFEQVLIWGGAGLAALGVLGLIVCVLRAIFGRRTDPDEAASEA